MSTLALFIELLNSSRTEQQPVSIYLTNAILNGTVSNVTQDSVELRTAGGKKCIISLDSIEAIETL
jgi:sRNA-binding regulator protein Hfq